MRLSDWIAQLQNLRVKYGDAVLRVELPGGLPQYQVVSQGGFGYDTQLLVTAWFDGDGKGNRRKPDGNYTNG